MPGADPLRLAARHARRCRARPRPLDPSADARALREAFGLGLPDAPRDPAAVIEDLVRAAEPGLVGNTEPAFFAWVMGGSHPAGVAADWLTSAWGQNAAIYQTAPAAAIAEEVAARYLLDLLDLPAESSVGFTTGATMGGFICLAAARGEVLRRAGCDPDAEGLQGAPRIGVFIGAEAHASNFAALRYLGFGERNLFRIPADDQGRLDPAVLDAALAGFAGPKIVVAQAGQVNTGAFDRFDAIADAAAAHGAWLHTDGAFGLWARAVPELRPLCRGAGRAQSWAVDGHKWLQLPYDSGFAIIRNADAHRRAMDITASYLNEDPADGRNPTQYGPELSRRARGFVAWAMFQTLGRNGIAEMIRRHCACARRIAERLAAVPGIRIENEVVLNQVVVSFGSPLDGTDPDRLTIHLVDRLNRSGRAFVRPTLWGGRQALRLSVISPRADLTTAEALADRIETCWRDLLAANATSRPAAGHHASSAGEGTATRRAPNAAGTCTSKRREVS